jgi:hypothetical protein
MEECYSTLSAVYNSLEEKEKIICAINDAIVKYGLTPDVIIRPDSQNEPGKGRIIVEFGFNDRKSGEFFEYLIKECKLVCE